MQKDDLRGQEEPPPKQMPLFKATWYSQPPYYLLTQLGDWLACQQNEGMGALQYYEAALALNPTYGFAAFNGGKVMMESGDFKQAREWFLKSLKADPDHAPTLYKLSVCSFEMGDYASCIDYADQCLALNPQHEGAYAAKIRSFYCLEQWDELIQQVETSLTPEHREMNLYYTLALLKVGEFEKAKVQYGKIDLKSKHRFPVLFDEIMSTIDF
jgi:tetratricopeptide (TPR) repeat protein